MLALLVAGAWGTARAQDSSPIEVTNSVYQEIEVTAEDGSVSKTLVPATRVVPGSEVIYELNYRNNGDVAATNVRVDNPVPQALVFVDAPVPADVVSVDGGEHFGSLADLQVMGADGTPRPAQPSDITNLRWIIPSLAAGAEGKVVYRARIK